MQHASLPKSLCSPLLSWLLFVGLQTLSSYLLSQQSLKPQTHTLFITGLHVLFHTFILIGVIPSSLTFSHMHTLSPRTAVKHGNTKHHLQLHTIQQLNQYLDFSCKTLHSRLLIFTVSMDSVYPTQARSPAQPVRSQRFLARGTLWMQKILMCLRCKATAITLTGCEQMAWCNVFSKVRKYIEWHRSDVSGV